MNLGFQTEGLNIPRIQLFAFSFFLSKAYETKFGTKTLSAQGIKCVDFPRKSDFAIMPSKFDVPHSPNAARRCKGISSKWTSGTREAKGWIGANGCAAAAAACSSPPCRSARFDSSCVVRFR